MSLVENIAKYLDGTATEPEVLQVINAANRFVVNNNIGVVYQEREDSPFFFRAFDRPVDSLWTFNPTTDNEDARRAIQQFQTAFLPILNSLVESESGDYTRVADGLLDGTIETDLDRIIESDRGRAYYDFENPDDENRDSVFVSQFALLLFVIAKSLNYRDRLKAYLDSQEGAATLPAKAREFYREAAVGNGRSVLSPMVEALYGDYIALFKAKKLFIDSNGTNEELWKLITDTESKMEADILAKRAEIQDDGVLPFDIDAAIMQRLGYEGGPLFYIYDLLVYDPFKKLQAEVYSQRVDALGGIAATIGSGTMRALGWVLKRMSGPLRWARNVGILLYIIYLLVEAFKAIMLGFRVDWEGICGDACSQPENTEACKECLRKAADSDSATGLNKAILYSSVTLAGLIGLRILIPALRKPVRPLTLNVSEQQALDLET